MERPWWSNSGFSGWKMKRSSWGSMYNRYRFWDYDSNDDLLTNREELERMLGVDTSLPSTSESSQSAVLEVDDDEIGHDDLDDEICFGTIRGNIVGLQYYKGTVNKNEMVALEREPQNRYDINAIKVKNVGNIQVGHIKTELAKPLAYIWDKELARLEGVVPFGYTNVYSMPVDITLWGKPEHQQEAVKKLESCGYYLTGGTQPVTSSQGAATSSQTSTSCLFEAFEPHRTYLTPAEVKNELDKLFENIQEGDKTSLAEPAEAIVTPLYPHQKQALNWMIKQENSATLPPFWEERAGKYFNTVLNFTTDIRPDCVKGGILADDMGLGKTLEMITLIVTNFVDNKPLAKPVPGLVRQTRLEKMASEKAKILPTGDDTPCPMKLAQLKLKSRKFLSCHIDRLMSLISPENIETPKLPSLPVDQDEVLSISDSSASSVDQDEVLSISDSSDESNDDDAMSIPSVDEKTMVKKEGPAFCPVVKSKGKRTKVKENKSPEVTHTSWPRRSVKRPAHYTYSEEDELINAETPKKKVLQLEVPSGDPGPQESSANLVNEDVVEKTEIEMKSIETVTVKMEESSPIDRTAEDPCDELPDIDEGDFIGKTELPEIPSKQEISNPDESCSSSDTVIQTDYTKAEMKEVGESTGRSATTGRRCTLIVCPLSVISNWLDQLDDHVHRNVHLSIYLYYGLGRTKNSNLLENQDIVLTTYSTVAADFKKGAKNPLQKVKWLRVVLDEGHTIKNPAAQQTKAILELDAERKWVLTGTPIQNSMKDLWSLINFVKVNPFTDRRWWRRTIERPLEKGDESALTRVQHLMNHVALRRTKTQQVNGRPLVQLPERNVFTELIQLSEEERKVYDSMQNEGKLIVSKYFRQGTLLHHYGDVLAILMRLRQLCCHPFLVAKAAEAMKDTLAEIDQNGGLINDEVRQKLIDKLILVLGSGTDEECAICLDTLKTPVITHCAHVFCRPCIESVIKNERPNPKCPLCRGVVEDDKLLEVPPEEINGESGAEEGSSIQPDTWKSSAKVDALMSALLKLRSEDSSAKSLVVSQFTSFLTLLETPLCTSGFRFVRLDGSMNTKARTQAIEEFSDPSSGSPTIFLLSLKAGGVGINLTAASRVFLIDPAWNPASEEQCFDRCHRLGQTKDVVITKFIVEDSVEERMLELQEKKRKLMQGAFGQKQTAEEKRQARIRDIKTLFSF